MARLDSPEEAPDLLKRPVGARSGLLVEEKQPMIGGRKSSASSGAHDPSSLHLHDCSGEAAAPPLPPLPTALAGEDMAPPPGRVRALALPVEKPIIPLGFKPGKGQMGHLRIVFTDATTAEVITALKTLGFLETTEGGCFLSQHSPIQVHSLWGKAPHYPDLLRNLPFSPRVQIHFKSVDDAAALTEVLHSCSRALLGLSAKTRIQAFDTDTSRQIPSPVSKS
jgi:hypothetical protein